jgi:DNA polymerase-1
MRVLLLVDVSYQIYRAAAANPGLSSRRIFTGGLYGFFTTVSKIIRETRATHVVFGRDAKPYLRSATYPQYKQLRKEKADEDLRERYEESVPLVLGALRTTGAPVWSVPGFEFDDLMGHCVLKYRHRFDELWAASNDSDLYQLLWCDRFRVYHKDKADAMDRKRLAARFGLTPAQHMLATALMGTHNDIDGIAGVGIKRASDAAKDPALLRTYRERHGALIDRNLGLIRLPHPQFPWATELPRAEHEFVARDLYRELGRYDVDVTANVQRAFEQINTRNQG